MKKTTVVVSTISFLQIIFIVLKLTKVVKWSWLLILIPFWLLILLVVITILMELLLEYTDMGQ